MNQPQTHIVYQNRAQHDFYESGMLIPLIGGLSIGVLVFLALIAIANKVSRGWRGPGNVITDAAVVAAFAAGGLMFHYLFI